ncbi:hypothetical protein [Nonomuraea sp. NPDC050786]|uniref:hypothetical protein n=1 Tax=Nonomuraea sp. NPDC050786 TaxID=3154840 RepID=UPI0034022419
MEQIVVDSTVDGILAALFAVLVVVVILDALRVWVKAIRSREPLPTTETPFEESKIVVPAGLSRDPAGAGGARGVAPEGNRSTAGRRAGGPCR